MDLPTAILVLSISAPITVTIAGFFLRACVQHLDGTSSRLQQVAVAVGKLEACVDALREFLKLTFVDRRRHEGEPGAEFKI